MKVRRLPSLPFLLPIGVSTGALFTAMTVRLTVARFESATPSLARYVKLSGPA